MALANPCHNPLRFSRVCKFSRAGDQPKDQEPRRREDAKEDNSIAPETPRHNSLGFDPAFLIFLTFASLFASSRLRGSSFWLRLKQTFSAGWLHEQGAAENCQHSEAGSSLDRGGPGHPHCGDNGLGQSVSQPIEIFARCANFPGQAISQKIKSREDAKTRSREAAKTNAKEDNSIAPETRRHNSLGFDPAFLIFLPSRLSSRLRVFAALRFGCG